MNKNSNLSQLDVNQMAQKMFDEKLDAQRVSIVGGSDIKINIDPSQITDAIKDGLKNFNTNIPVNNAPIEYKQEFLTIKENVFIPQIQKIEVPIIIREIEYKTVEIPIIVKEYVTVEIPVIHKEIEFKEVIKERNYPLIIKVCTVLQTIAVIGILLFNFLRK